MRKYILSILGVLLFFIGAAQPGVKVNFGGSRPQDTAWAARAMRVDDNVQFLKYATNDTNIVAGFDGSGNIVARKKGNPIDTAALLAPYATKAKVQADSVVLAGQANQRVKYTDTAAMLAPYATDQDVSLKENTSNKTTSANGTSNFLYPTQGAVKSYVDGQDALNVKIGDTATMLSPYARKQALNDTAATLRSLVASNNATTVKYADTAAMLAPYATKAKVLADSTVLAGQINQRIKYSDSASMLNPYARKPFASGSISDSLVVADPSTGVLKRIAKSRLAIPTANVANVRDYGAVGDGVTNDGTAFAAAVATGKDVYVPASSAGYALSAVVTLQSGQALYGDGANSKLIFQNPYATGFYMLKCVGFNNVEGLQFFVGLKPAWIGDNPALWTEGGIEVTGFANTIHNCWFKTISGAGVHVKGQNTNVTACYVDDNNCGILVSSEYNHVADIIGSNNRRAVYITTGNNTLSGGNFSGGGGLYYNNISNGDHSSVIGCTFNHCNNSSLEFKNTGSGLNVIGCNVWDGEIKITENNGLNISNSTIGTAAYFTVSGTNTNCVIQNNYVVNTVTLPSDPGIRLRNNFGGASNKYPRSLDQTADVATGTGGLKYAPLVIDGTTYYIKLETSIP